MVKRIYDGVICAAETCDRPARARGWCFKHYQRWLKHDDPNWEPPPRWVGETNPAWTGDDATYAGVHQRVQTKHGKASGHLCVECGEPANDWSLQHTADPADLRWDEKYRLWYSLDIDDYVARCRLCHMRYDWGHKMVTRPRLRGADGRFLPHPEDD